MFTPLRSQLHAQWAHKCLAAHTLFNTRVTCTPLLYNHGDSPLCAELQIYMQLSALQNLCEKQRTDLITCWQGAKQVISKHGDVCTTASADCDSFAISEISSVFCSQHIYATLFTLSTADLLLCGSVEGIRWLNSGTSPCLALPESKANLMAINTKQKIRTNKQSRTIWGWTDQPEESDFCLFRLKTTITDLYTVDGQTCSANIKAEELMLEQIYPLKSAYMFTGDICWGLLVKSCVRSGILSSVNT